MKFRLPPTLLALLAAPIFVPLAMAEDLKTDFPEVAATVADLLGDAHYHQQDFDDNISRRALRNYLEYLDFSKLYFTAPEVDAFKAKYETTLDDCVPQHDLKPAREIYDLYAKKLTARYAKIEAQLKAGDMDFKGKETVEISRKDSAWAKSEADLDELWRKEIIREVLQEHLNARRTEERRKEKAEKKAVEKKEGEDAAKPEEKKVEKKIPDSPEQKVLKRHKRYLDTIKENDEEDVTNYFLSSIALAYDPHSEYFSAPEQANFAIDMKKALIGIGAVLSAKDGAAEIKSLVPAGPADKNGKLKVGDLVVGVAQGLEAEMEDVEGMKLNRIVEKIRGAENTTVRLKVVPAEDPTIVREIVIVREKVEMKDTLAKGELIECSDPSNTGKAPVKIGWLNLDSFYADMENRNAGGVSCSEHTKRILTRLMKEGAEGIVLDLRGNGGGSLEEAIRMTGLFVKAGPVVQQQDNRERIDPRRWKGQPVYNGPLVVLIDRASASASEICAAALQDSGRAVVVGDETTFGKGTVQTILDLKEAMPYMSNKERAGSLKVTIAKFFRINGESTQLDGVASDVVLPSIYDGLEVGEKFLKDPLPHSTIKPLDFDHYPALPVAELKKRSAARVEANKDFAFIKGEVTRRKELIKKNTIVLNEEERINEDKSNEARQKTNREERKARVAEANKAGDPFRVYPIEQETADAPLKTDDQIPKKKDTAAIMRGEDEEDGVEAGNEFPHGFDPVKMEAMNIMRDLVQLTAKPQAPADGTAKNIAPSGTVPGRN